MKPAKNRLKQVVAVPDSARLSRATKTPRQFSDIRHDDLHARASRSLSFQPRPFLRWAGSKRALLRHIVDVLPNRYATYREPFLGSGSLFFLLQPTQAVLSDSCFELVQTFRSVRDGVESVLEYLSPLKRDKEQYYEIRSSLSSDPIERAAQFIYLNKMCWNGLYRVNSKGEFNVPYGAPKTDFIVDAANLLACSSALKGEAVELACADFEDAVAEAREGDLIFLDPPYVSGHNNNGFIDYNETLFSWRDQIRLAALAKRLADLGANVIITNALNADIRELYGDFEVRSIDRASTLASASAKRVRVQEAVYWKVN
jgi:DNA adenine methylase